MHSLLEVQFGSRPLSCLILHLMDWHGGVVVVWAPGWGSCEFVCCLLLVLFVLFFFCVSEGGDMLSHLSSSVLVIVVCIRMGCWWIVWNSLDHA